MTALKGWTLQGQLRLLLSGLVVLVLFWISPASGSRVETYSTADESWQGMTELVKISRQVFSEVRLKGELNYAELEAGDALLIVSPETELDARSLTSFLADGGKLAILDDYGQSDSFLAKFPIRKLTAPQKPYRTVNQNPELAIAEPLSQRVAGAETGRHPIVSNVELIVTNHPKTLSHPQLTEIAAIRAANGEFFPIAVTGIIGDKGKLVVVSDPSIGINFMLRYPGNRQFIEGLLKYLTMPVAARTEEVQQTLSTSITLHIATGAFSQRGSYGSHSNFLNLIQKQISAAQKILKNVTEDGFPKLLILILSLTLLSWILFRWMGETLDPELLLKPLMGTLHQIRRKSLKGEGGNRKDVFFELLAVIDGDFQRAFGIKLMATQVEIEKRLSELQVEKTRTDAIFLLRHEILIDVKEAKRLVPRLPSLSQQEQYYLRGRQVIADMVLSHPVEHPIVGNR